MSELITPAEYARRRKVRSLSGGTAECVIRAIESGRISLIDGKIDPEVADIQWEKNTRKRADLHSMPPVVEAPSTSPVSTSSAWADSKARTEAAVAELKELELAERKGNLIDRAGYERAAQKTNRMIRDAFVEVLPAKLAAELAGMSDPWLIECRLRETNRDTLTAIAGQLRAEAEPA